MIVLLSHAHQQPPPQQYDHSMDEKNVSLAEWKSKSINHSTYRIIWGGCQINFENYKYSSLCMSNNCVPAWVMIKCSGGPSAPSPLYATSEYGHSNIYFMMLWSLDINGLEESVLISDLLSVVVMHGRVVFGEG